MNCPFCNSELFQAVPSTNQAKPACPRCGEPLPPDLAAALPVASPQPPADDGLPPIPVEANRRTLLVVLAIMFFMAALGLTYALLTVDFRRSHDPKPLGAPVRPPERLEGLGWLPGTSRLVAAVNVADLFLHREGQALLEKPLPAGLDRALGMLERKLAVKLAHLDHVALGVEFGERLPHATLVVRTNRPVPPAELADLPGLDPAGKRHDRPLFRFPLEPVGEALVWCAGDRTLVIHLGLEGSKGPPFHPPAEPRAGIELLPDNLRDLVARRIDRNSLLWAAANLDGADFPKDFLALVPGGADWRLVNGLACSLRIQDGWLFLGQFRIPDDDFRAALQVVLAKAELPHGIVAKLESPPPDAPPAERPWLTWQVRGDSPAIRRWLDPVAAMPLR